VSPFDAVVLGEGEDTVVELFRARSEGRALGQLSFLFRPLRVIRTLVKAVATVTEDTRYAKWFVDRFYTRRRWRKLAESAPR
jgi:radical SAM superfamily enzyme YgiQ (UPF0313 family)